MPDATSLHHCLLKHHQYCKKYYSAPQGCPVDWHDLMMVLGGAVMKEEDL